MLPDMGSRNQTHILCTQMGEQSQCLFLQHDVKARWIRDFCSVSGLQLLLSEKDETLK